ncbi:signal transduction histidine kinase [Formosa agariphila KMM 3901]|uniref:Signal transduction histidine kinase n=1 Tax=Formosa agariphila (strain DSM 15362 / KCTC 12365 / LMG 23005 / KMM 3901 / M-2Alg 35-1) TaxID=1347342 RepID=T2KN20_FORAG|nr:sensor histidine kinase [Formosa agariphila]CDF79379.1 signal transduction histidine kinase [Formosa agariphila KMM 3901]
MTKKTQLFRILKQEGFIHLVIWAIFLFMFFLQVYFNTGRIPKAFLNFLIVGIFSFYINYLVLVPYFLLKKKNGFYFVAVIGLIVICVVLVEFVLPKPDIIHHLPPPQNDMNALGERPNFRGIRIGFPLFFNIILIVIGTAIKMYIEWDKNIQHQKEVESQKSSAELHFLKNQLSPHFLFNSLNSIYSLTSKKSNDAPEAVIMLSELMRYMLYQADNEFVMLNDELDYIQNYLKLQRLRIANNRDVTLLIRGGISQQKIRPLLLIAFIENAFKYGTDFKGNTLVRIEIIVNANELNFKCVNLIGNRKQDPENSGIGLQNTKDRLQLLYPNLHTLKIDTVDSQYIVNLNLNLSV